LTLSFAYVNKLPDLVIAAQEYQSLKSTRKQFMTGKQNTENSLGLTKSAMLNDLKDVNQFQITERKLIM